MEGTQETTVFLTRELTNLEFTLLDASLWVSEL